MSDDDSEESNFVEIAEDDDPTVFNIEAAFGIKNEEFIYLLQFSKDPVTFEFNYLFTICESDDEDEEIFTWENISLTLRPVFLDLIQLFLSLPDLLATRYQTYTLTDNVLVWSVEESHCFLTILEKARQHNFSETITRTISLLHQEYVSLLRSFENLTLSFFKIKSFLEKCQVVYEGCQVYEKFAVAELFNLNRHHCFSQNFIANLFQAVTHFSLNEQYLNKVFSLIMAD
jgi:hypothetical protein